MPPAKTLLSRDVHCTAIELSTLPSSLPNGLSARLKHHLLFQVTCPHCFKTFANEWRCQQHQAKKEDCRVAAEHMQRMQLGIGLPNACV
jgi:hypothetical protein